MILVQALMLINPNRNVGLETLLRNWITSAFLVLKDMLVFSGTQIFPHMPKD